MKRLMSGLPPFALAAAAALAIAAMRAFSANPNPALAWMLIALAALCACVAFAPSAHLIRETRLIAVEWRGRAWLIGGAALSAAGAALALWAAITNYSRPYFPPGFYAWAGGLATVVAGFALMQRRRPKTSAPPDRPVTRLEVVGFLALVAITIFLRVYRIDEIPSGIFIDETNAAMDAMHVLDGRPDSIFGTGWYETPYLYIYYQAALVVLFGPTYATLKLTSLLPAVLTVIAFYPLARTLIGAPGAFVTTLLFAVARWHLTLSRWGWNELAPPLFHILAVLFLVRAARNRRMIEFALAGLMAGLCMYTYLASRLVVVAIALYVLYRFVVDRGFFRRSIGGLAIAAAVFLLTIGPLATQYLRSPFTLLNRTQQVSIFGEIERAGNNTPLLQSARKHIEMFTIRGDMNPRHNLPGEPMLDPITGALFLIGVGGALWRITDHRSGLALIWFVVTMLGGVLTQVGEAPQAYRTLTALPAILLLAGDTLTRAGVLLRQMLARLRPAASPRYAIAGAALVSLGLVGLAAKANLDVYFGPQARSEAVYQGFTPVENAVAKEVLARLPTSDVYLSDVQYSFSPVRYLTYRPKTQGGGIDNPPYKQIDLNADIPLPDNGRDAVLVLDQSFGWVGAYLRQYYPGATVETVRGPRNDVQFTRVLISQQDLARIQGIEGSYGGTIRRDQRLDFAFPADFPAGATPETIIWEGSLRVPASGVMKLGGDGLAIELDSQPFNEPRFVGRGLYALKATWRSPGPAGRTTLRWQLGGRAETAVPAEALSIIKGSTAGLIARYYRNETWTGTPVFTQTQSFIVIGWPDEEPWSGPFSISFAGKIEAPVQGRYAFSVNADDGARLSIDGRVIGEGLKPDQPNSIEAAVVLTPGPHEIRLDYFQRGGGKRLEFWWQPPNGPRQPVPPSVLSH